MPDDFESRGRGERGMTAHKSAGDVAASYVPKILRNMAEICEEMGVGEKTVKKWVAQGAPIAVEGSKKNVRYSAEAVRLQLWRETMADKQKAGT